MTAAMPAVAGLGAAVPAASVPLSFVLGDGHAAGSQAALLAGLIDPAFLAEAGWDPRGQVLAPPPGHRLLGRPDHAAAGAPPETRRFQVKAARPPWRARCPDAPGSPARGTGSCAAATVTLRVIWACRWTNSSPIRGPGRFPDAAPAR